VEKAAFAGTVQHFKRFFGAAVRANVSPSSSASWAEADLNMCMNAASVNAPLFIEAFCDA